MMILDIYVEFNVYLPESHGVWNQWNIEIKTNKKV